MPMSVTNTVMQRRVSLDDEEKEKEENCSIFKMIQLTFLSCKLIKRSRRKFEKFSFIKTRKFSIDLPLMSFGVQIRNHSYRITCNA